MALNALLQSAKASLHTDEPSKSDSLMTCARKHTGHKMVWAFTYVTLNGLFDSKKDKVVRVASGQGALYSQFFRPITTALRQVAMSGIACTIERVER